MSSHVADDMAGIQGGAATDYLQTIERCHTKTAPERPIRDTAGKLIEHSGRGFGLLVDLFGHVVDIAVQFGVLAAPDTPSHHRGGTATTIVGGSTYRGQLHHIAVFEHPELVGPVTYRGNVTRREVAVSRVGDEQRRMLSGDHYATGVLLEHRE